MTLERRLSRLEAETPSAAVDGECTCSGVVSYVVDWSESPTPPTPERCPVCGGLVRVLVIDERIVFRGDDAEPR